MNEAAVIDKPLRGVIEDMTPVRARQILKEGRLVMGEPRSMAAAQVVDECAMAREIAFCYANRERLVRRFVSEGIRPARLNRFLPQVVDEVMGELKRRLGQERQLAERARRAYRNSGVPIGSFTCPLCQNLGQYETDHKNLLKIKCCLGEFAAKLKPPKVATID